MTTAGPAVGTVAALHRYPVKSMLGEELASVDVGPGGLVGDRAYAVVDAVDHTVASAKHPRKWARLLQMRAEFTTEPVAGEPPPPVVLTFPDGSTLRSDGAGVDAALSAAVGRPVRLAAQPPAEPRFEELWPDIDGLAPADFISGTTTSVSAGEPVSTIGLAALAPAGTFFDLSVLHILTTATLARLGRAAPDSRFHPQRYRPNLLLQVPGAAFSEDAWLGGDLRVGPDLAARVTMPTMRCVMTTLAQGGPDGLGEDRGTLRTIARENRRTIAGMGTWACAGVYADVSAPGRVHRGDPVRHAPGA